MADVVALRPLSIGVPVEHDPVLSLSRRARDAADQRAAIVARADRGMPVPVSPATLRRWRHAMDTGGLAALAPNYKGKQRRPQPWDARALEYVQLPTRLNSGQIAFNLRRDGFANVTRAQVRRFRKTLPSNLDETSPKKLGKHFYRLNETPYVVREWGGVPVGYLYEMDGHTCDFYIEHPVTGGYFRPELTFLWDVRSQYLVDFWLGGFENSMELRWLLSRAFVTHDHVCHELHIDPGAGTAKTMANVDYGFCAKLDVDLHFALPGNARGKGLTEGAFGLFEGRFGKTMPTYLHDRTDDAMRLFADKWKKRLVPRITVRQLYDLIATRFVQPTRDEPRKGLDGKSPAELWATLCKNPVLAPIDVLVRPRAPRTVQNGRITIHKRRYQLPQPQRAQWEDRQVVVEYDEWSDDQVWIRDPQDRFVCAAPLLHRKPGLPPSRVAEKLARTAAGQRKRAQLKIDEADARAHLPLSAASALDALQPPTAQPAPGAAQQVLSSGTAFTNPTLPMRPPARVAPAALEHLRAEAAADEASRAAASETPDQRLARALALQRRVTAGESLTDPDARWLALYTASPEYHSRIALLEESDGDLPEMT